MTRPKALTPDYERGGVTLYCGDALDVLRQLPDQCVQTCVTSPPYWGLRDYGVDGQLGLEQTPEEYVAKMVDVFREVRRVLKEGGALLCFCQWRGQEDFRTAIRLAGFEVRSRVIWDRCNGGMGATHTTFAPRHDVIWFATKGRFRFPAGRPDSILAVPNIPPAQRMHSTQKPDELMRRLVRAVTPAGGLVFDPCAGSGSTGVAAIAAGCRFVGIELDAENHATACRRLSSADRRQAKRCRADAIHAYRGAGVFACRFADSFLREVV
jgi:site-specific DNA-methyltransferase (adenine-specific)